MKMFKVSVRVWRLICVGCLLFVIAYFADLLTEYSFFNISQFVNWQIIVLPSLIVLAFAPTAAELEQYVKEKQLKKQARSDEDE